MSQLSVYLIKSSIFTFFEKKVKPKNFKYHSIFLFNKQLLCKLEVFERCLEKTFNIKQSILLKQGKSNSLNWGKFETLFVKRVSIKKQLISN